MFHVIISAAIEVAATLALCAAFVTFLVAMLATVGAMALPAGVYVLGSALWRAEELRKILRRQ